MKRFLTVLPLFLVLSACGGASAEGLKETIMGQLDKLPGMIESIKDKASLDANKGALEKLISTVSTAKDSLKALPESEETKKITGEVESKMGSIKDKVMAALAKIGDAGIVDQLKGMLKKLFPSMA